MNIDSFAITFLLSITEFLGVPKTPSNESGWNITQNWTEKNGTLVFEANSHQIIKECQKHFSASVSFPSIIHSVQQIELDGRRITQFGDPSFNTARSFYGSPTVHCNDLLAGQFINWRVFSQSKYFSRVSRFPRIEKHANLQNLFSEVTNVVSAGALLLFEILIVLLFLGRIPHLLAVSLITSIFFLAVYFVLCVPDFFEVPISMLSAHRFADISAWTGLFFLCCTLAAQKLLTRTFLKITGISVGVSVCLICLAQTEDGIQLGTTIPMPFVLPTLGIATFRSFKKFFSGISGRRGLLESLSLALFVGTLFHDCFLVVGLIEGPALASFGLIFGLLFFLVALNEYVITAFQERDQLKLQNLHLTRKAEFASLARQVSHDIRSPLAALNAVLNEFSDISEDIRRIAEMAIERIQYIANGLLTEAKTLNGHDTKVNETLVFVPSSEISRVFLPSIAEEIIIEKRVQLRAVSHVKVELALKGLFETMFLNVQPKELKRVLSNLINNSSEAIIGSGSVVVTIGLNMNTVFCRISDDGKGIPKEIVPSLMQEGNTFGKENGNGLGLYYAKKAMETWGGSLEIESELGQGTVVTLTFPRVEPPAWYASEILFPSNGAIIILDDDASTHEVWKSRIKTISTAQSKVETLHFYSGRELQTWFFNRSPKDKPCLYLFDYEFRGTSVTGLELIRELGIASQSILVTSHFEEETIQKKCEELGVKMIPKSTVSLISIKWRI